MALIVEARQELNEGLERWLGHLEFLDLENQRQGNPWAHWLLSCPNKLAPE